MSVEENRAMARRSLEEVMNKGNLSVVDEIMATSYVFHFPGQDYKGPEGFKQMVTMWRTAFPDLHFTIDDMFAEGDKVARRITMRGTHRGDLMGIAPTGKQVTITAILISLYEDGKEVEAWGISDMLGMMQQLGVFPPIG
jgi:predicted ester cyclase